MRLKYFCEKQRELRLLKGETQMSRISIHFSFTFSFQTTGIQFAVKRVFHQSENVSLTPCAPVLPKAIFYKSLFCRYFKFFCTLKLHAGSLLVVVKHFAPLSLWSLCWAVAYTHGKLRIFKKTKENLSLLLLTKLSCWVWWSWNLKVHQQYMFVPIRKSMETLVFSLLRWLVIKKM